MNFRFWFFSFVFWFSVMPAQAEMGPNDPAKKGGSMAQSNRPSGQFGGGLNDQVKKCASLLPHGRKYRMSVIHDIDQTGDLPVTTGRFSINWAPEHFPSAQEQEKAFKTLEPFIMCVEKHIGGESTK